MFYEAFRHRRASTVSRVVDSIPELSDANLVFSNKDTFSLESDEETRRKRVKCHGRKPQPRRIEFMISYKEIKRMQGARNVNDISGPPLKSQQSLKFASSPTGVPARDPSTLCRAEKPLPISARGIVSNAARTVQRTQRQLPNTLYIARPSTTTP